MRVVFLLGVLSIALGISSPVAGELAMRQVQVGEKHWQFMAVVDGDTIRVLASDLPPPLAKVLIRIRGVDTPEIGAKAKCPRELENGEKARIFTETFLSQGEIRLEHLEWDKYGGRILADLYVGGKSLAQSLLAEKLAHAYDGGKRGSWCVSPA